MESLENMRQLAMKFVGLVAPILCMLALQCKHCHTPLTASLVVNPIALRHEQIAPQFAKADAHAFRKIAVVPPRLEPNPGQ